jgi:hypothetical protein
MKLDKKKVFILSIIGTVMLLVPFLYNAVFDCYKDNIFICSDDYGYIAILLISSLPVLLFSLVTFWMKEAVFKAWYAVASWFVPVIVLTTIYLNATSSNGGFFNMDKEINFLILLTLYSLFFIISIWKIVATYRKTKNI